VEYTDGTCKREEEGRGRRVMQREREKEKTRERERETEGENKRKRADTRYDFMALYPATKLEVLILCLTVAPAARRVFVAQFMVVRI